ncbi:hypothetical protein N7475_002516 [Penicillium sp. IBT 31633x]|nr:hypothetical protein N7475_002516 [Penicillium sp. IBT 31633x]
MIGTDQASQDILDIYDEVRRQKYRDIVDQPRARIYVECLIAALKRRFELGNDKFLEMSLKAEKDVKLARDMALGTNVLEYDFSQHYKNLK